MRSLVIGGTRNLGPSLVQALIARGDAVSVLNRGLTPGALPAGAERLLADRSDTEQLRNALHRLEFDLVVDTTLYTGADAALVARLLAGRIGRYVWWSTGQVYLVRLGAQRPFRETDYDGPEMTEPGAPHTLDHRNWVYGIGKRRAEDALKTAFRLEKFPATSLRMPMIASERDHYTRIAAYVRRIVDGGPILVTEEPAWPIRHVYGGDVIRATLQAARADVAGQAFNIGQDDTLDLVEMIALLAHLLGRPVPPLVALPRQALEDAGLLPTCSPFSDPWMSSLDNSRSKAALGLRYTTVDEYLPKCVDAALALPPERVIGYERRQEELQAARRPGG